MGEERYRTCQKCGTINLNRDYCSHCGHIVNINLERKLKREEKAQKKEEQAAKDKNQVTLFFERVLDHKNPFIRYTAKFFYSIWVVVLAIGSFLALIFSYIAA
jgi:uncharacterized Zn finger protein (UPF0148 family)